MGRYHAKVADLYNDYIRPQENGNHHATEWAAVRNENGDGIVLCSENGFEFQALPYTAEEMEKAEHSYKLYKFEKTVVRFDGKISGMGSHSCGPEVAEKYRVPKEFTMRVKIRGIHGGQNRLLSLTPFLTATTPRISASLHYNERITVKNYRLRRHAY